MAIKDGMVQSSRILGSAVASIFNRKDIEICSICKAQLENGKCPNGHTIV